MYQMLWLRGVRDHTISGRGFNLSSCCGAISGRLRSAVRFSRATILAAISLGMAAAPLPAGEGARTRWSRACPGAATREETRARIFSFREFSMLCSQDNFRARGKRCRDQIGCGGAELDRVGVVHFLASRGQTRATISAFPEFSILAGRKISAPPGREKAAARQARSRRSRRSAALARNRKVRPSPS